MHQLKPAVRPALLPDEYRKARHYGFEVATHIFYSSFEKENKRKPSYEEWKAWNEELYSSKSWVDLNKVMDCPVCMNHINKSKKEGTPLFPIPKEAVSQLKSMGLKVLSNSLALKASKWVELAEELEQV